MSLLLALFGGLLTSLSPCVIPLLPLVVGSAGTRHRLGPVALCAGLILSFSVLAIAVAFAIKAFSFDPGVILTNGLQVVQRGRPARAVVRQQIAEIIISEEIGFAKPAKEFFDAALARLGHPSPREALMISDAWRELIGCLG